MYFNQYNVMALELPSTYTSLTCYSYCQFPGATYTEVCARWGNAKALISQGSHITGILARMNLCIPYFSVLLIVILKCWKSISEMHFEFD